MVFGDMTTRIPNSPSIMSAPATTASTTPPTAPPTYGDDRATERDDPRVLWAMVALFWVVNVALTGAEVYAMARSRGFVPRLLGVFVFLIPGYLVWLATVPVIVQVLTRRFAFESGRWGRSLLAHLLASVIIASATQAADAVMMLLHDDQLSFIREFAAMAQTWILWELFTYWFLVVLVLAVRHYTTAVARQRRATELAAAVANAQLAVLRTQVHPHFLFNALNSISSLVFDEPREAQKMIARLGELLRATLAEDGFGSWTLRKELEILERYTAIEQVRFGDRLRVAVECEPATLDALVPSLLLQPLVENAILHGIQPSMQGGAVRISARREGPWLRLAISDDGVGIDGDTNSGRAERVGLSNTRARLETEFGDDQSLRITRGEPGTQVEIRIPWSTAEAIDGAAV
jgi:two-component system, LytTR family, sensor kinase